ncbi:MAG: hypothetical protein KDD33_03100 [Bdellovibrionales bacterium]|nr:hypothetical protein [Bdellovibrionales bacterium]
MEITVEWASQQGWITQKTAAVYDFAFIKALKSIPWQDWINTPETFRIREEYLETYHHWLQSSSLQKIRGLDAFPIRHLTNGTTQSFDEAYFEYRSRRLRIFRGEYAYHRRVFPHWKFIEDEPLAADDFIIVSAPFCSTGEVHPQTSHTLDEALKLNVPVILDCAYIGTCAQIDFNADHPAILSVCFSLTKGLGLGDIRSGIRYSRIDNQGSISQQNQYNHSVLCAAKIGLYMMKHFSVDHIPLKFRGSQLAFCKDLSLQATPVMHIALGDQKWKSFEVDGLYNRVGIRNGVKAYYQGRTTPALNID